MSDTVQQELNDGVLTITLNRPKKKNAFNDEQWFALADALKAADENDDVVVVLLTGEGGNFSSGMDLTSPPNTSEDGKLAFESTAYALAHLNKPIVGAASGVAVGGGATILFHMDVLYVGETLRMRLPFASLGLVPEFGSTVTLPNIIGMRKAMELVFTTEMFGAEQAVEFGIATACFPENELLAAASEKARQIAQMPVRTLVECKRLMKAPMLAMLDEALERENASLKAQMGSPENMEAVMAFMEKREPDFRKLVKK